MRHDLSHAVVIAIVALLFVAVPLGAYVFMQSIIWKVING